MKNNWKKITIIAIFIVSFFVCILNIGKPVQQPFSTSLDLSNTSQSAYYIEGDKANVAIDTGNTRVLFLSKDNKLNATLQYQVHEDSVAFYNNCVFDNQNIYLLSYEKYNETGFIKNVKVISYDFLGNQKDVVWQKNFDESELANKSDLSEVELDSGITLTANTVDMGTSVLMPDKVEYSPFLIFKTYLFWLCLLYVAITLLIFVIIKVKQLITKKKTDLLLKVCICVAAILGIFGISYFYSSEIINEKTNIGINVLNLQTNNVLHSITDSDIDNLKLGDISSTKNKLNTFRNDSLSSHLNLNYSLYKPDTQTSVYSTRDNMMQGMQDDLQVVNSSDNIRIIKYTNQLGTFVSGEAHVVDASGQIVAKVTVDIDFLCTGAQILYSLINTFILLLIGVIIIALIIFELISWLKTRDIKKRYEKLKVKNLELSYSRIYVFLFSYLKYFDGVILVLIAKDLVVHNNLAGATILIALPASFVGVGNFIGQPFFSYFSRRVSIKSIFICVCALLCAMYLLSFYAIVVYGFWLYCFSCTITGLCIGIFNSTKSYMTALAPNEDIRFEVSNDMSVGMLGASLVSVAISGMVADAFGSQYIYIVALIPCCLLLLFSIFLMPAKVKYSDANKSNKGFTGFKTSLRYFFQPANLSFGLLIVIPAIIAGGYYSFLFPLYTDGAGLSKAMISNFVVIANFVTYLFNMQAKKWLGQSDYWKSTIFLCAGIGLVYTLFMLNNTVGWAVLAIAILTILNKLIYVVNNVMWPRLCKPNTEFSKSTGNSIILYTKSFANIARNAVLGALVGFGILYAFIIVGIAMIVCAILFLLFTWKSVLRKPVNK